MKLPQKSISIFLSVIMVFSLFTIAPFEASAESASDWSSIKSLLELSSQNSITLTADVKAGGSDACLTIDSGKDFTIDLNGCTLSRGRTSVDDNGSVIVVKNGGTLTITDSSADSSGRITGGYSKDGGAIRNEGTLAIEGGTITENIASEKGGAIYNTGTLTVSGGCITNNVSEDGGGIYNDSDGAATICGTAEITANKTTENGGGGITNLGTLTVSDNASISCNYGYSNGGGIWNGGTATVTGGSITGNSATKAGSGVFDQGTLNMQGSPVVKDNIGDDVFLSAGKTIRITGELDATARIGVSSAAEKPVITSGYGTYNQEEPSIYFFEDGEDCVSVVDSGGEVKLNTDGIAYVGRAWDAENSSVTKEIKHLTGYITASGSLSGLSGNNWYVVKGSVTVNSRTDNNGKANILLCDGASIEFKEGIRNQNNMGSELNIYAQQAGSGKLTASGEYDISPIGPQDNAKSGTVNIYGGVIDAGRGIGTAYKSAGGTVRIYGANVKCSAIGCGTKSTADTSVYIGVYNSTIKSALHNGAGVLDFYNSTLDTHGLLNQSAADVGGYQGCTKMGDINIVNSYVDADTKVGRGAAIGSCEDCDGGNIRIINSTVNAQCVKDNIYGLGYGAAIGGGQGGKGGNIVIEKSCVVAAAFTGAGIGGGKGKSGGSVTITDSVVMTSALQGGAGIGGGDDGHGGNINITRSYVYSKTESSQDVPDPKYASAGLSIMFEMMRVMTNGWQGNGSQVAYYHAGYMVAYFLTVLLAPTHGGAAIGGGDSGDSGTINITDSEITAIGGEYTAGIGGGDEGGCNNITITNSTVDATGGNYAAGIGSGDEANKMETITITGSTVTASSKKEGAGIGGGNDTSNHEIIITDSTVTATGGSYASGIGGGDDGSGGTINISFSTVTATGGKDAAGIGGGEDGDGGTVIISSSNVKANGKHYGAGIGCGESGSSATVEIYGRSTVEATAGGSGYATAIGTGDYIFTSPTVSAYIANGLVVLAGSSSSDTERFIGKDRYNAVWNSKYAKIYPCEHPATTWCYDNSSFHRKKCTECGSFTGDSERHIWNSENICTVCGCSAVMATLTFIEKNSAGEEVTFTVEAPKQTEYALPECTNVPDGMEFICWQINGDDWYGEPGDTVYVSSYDIVALYMPVVSARFIDSEGDPRTVQARQLSDEIFYLSPGWYVADCDLNYSLPYLDRTLVTAGDVRIILADGVTVSMGDSTGNSSARAIQAKNRLSTLSIYGQTAQSGVLRCDHNRIQLANFNMVGGNILSTGDVAAAIETNFVRGTLNADYFNSTKGFTFSGGNLAADRFITNIDNQLSWTNFRDSIRFNEINTLRNGTFTITDGQAFTDGENIYTGTLTPEQVNAIQGKTLTPYQLHHFGDPAWTWSDDHHHAAALFQCTDDDCDYQTEVDAVITSEEMADRVVYTATAEFNGETYHDEKVSYSDSFGAALGGHSVSLSGDIGVNFYMELSEDIANSETAYMQFTVPTGGAPDIQTVFVKDVEPTILNDKQYYVFKCHVAAKEMTSDISAQLFDGDRASREYSYSVKEYGDWLLEHAELPEFANAVPLVKAMLNYGAYAQIYFDKNPQTLANAHLAEADKVLGDMLFTAPDTAFSLPEGVTFEGATLSLKSETTLSLYFKSDETLVFGIEGKRVETATNGAYQVARIRGIAASELQDSFTLTVTAGESSGTIKYSPMNYCHNALNGGTTNDKLINAVKALYRYAQAAKAYFGQYGN